MTESINFHFTRVCNYKCKFCFHKQDLSGSPPSEEDSKKLMAILRHEGGMKKINFAGGEPLLYPEFLKHMLEYCKKDLGVYTSIITNGSCLTKEWLEANSSNIDMLGFSLDSLDDDTNYKLGRRPRHSTEDTLPQSVVVGKMVEHAVRLNIKIKINTVVTTKNYTETKLADFVAKHKITRWKVFQMMVLKGENDNQDTKILQPTREQFLTFVENNRQRFKELGYPDVLIPEDNETMQNSYVLVDHKLRFLDSSKGSKIPSEPILDVGFKKAYEQIVFDKDSFHGRKGDFYVSKLGDIEDL